MTVEYDTEQTAEQFDLRRLIRGLDEDLTDLRAGKISNVDAHARARLARAMIDAMALVVRARLMLEQKAKEALPQPDRPEEAFR